MDSWAVWRAVNAFYWAAITFSTNWLAAVALVVNLSTSLANVSNFSDALAPALVEVSISLAEMKAISVFFSVMEVLRLLALI